MKIGFVSMPFSGHLNPMTALARRLQSRGNEIVFFCVPDAEPFARAAGLNFVRFCENEYPAGSIAKLYGPVSKLHGLEATRWTIRQECDHFNAASQHLPQKLVEAGVEALVIDTMHAFVELVPMSLGIPYVHVWNIFPLDLSGATPPGVFSWPHESTPEALTRNLEGLKMAGELFAQVVPPAMSYAKKVGLKIDWNDPAATVSKLAVITQTPKEFDFPGTPWPAQFHYAGPFHDDEGREPVPFPWDELKDKPLIYASLGSLVNGLDHVYKHILGAVAALKNVQVVLSVGKNINPENLGPIPSNTIVVRSAPQIELLKRAALCITHAGLNTTLESLAQGVPMVAIPIAYDQPGVAARIAHHGTGEFIEVDELTTDRLRILIEKVLQDPSYRQRAEYFQRVISKTRGLDVAADIIEHAFQKYETKVATAKDRFQLESGGLRDGAVRRVYNVAIIGAGFGGLGMAARLKESGEDSFVILEKADGLGGTWRENTYPGCACDIPSHLYWYGFDEQPDWSRVFSAQTEILDKLQSFAERRGLRPYIRFNTEVTSARWDEGRSCWIVVTKDGGEIAATTLISAWGQLNRWQLPDIPGRDSFQGTAFHSSEWRHDVALEGKRVACIGSGASAIQIIPEVARQAGHVTVFQRSAPYVLPRMDRTYTPEERKLFAGDSNAFRADREAIYTACEARFDAMRPGSPKWQEATAMSRAHLEAQVSDPILRAKLWPDYPLGCKRVLFSDDFYPAMTLPHVKLETERISGIEPLGIRTADGRVHELDVIIYATGFETLSFLSVMDIKGRDGRSLREEWHDGASAYYGIAVAGFPNFFMICGPNTFVGHNSVIAMLECQFDYILHALRLMRERQASALEVRRDAMQRFDYEVQRRLQGSAWAGGCTSWYKNASGRITNNWCGSVEDYKHETARLEVADFELVPAAALGLPLQNSLVSSPQSAYKQPRSLADHSQPGKKS